MQISVKDTVYT